MSSPSHAVTYVTVEESNDDAVVFATAAAFTGVMVAWGCVVWGTGYYYPPYVGYGGGYPIYYPHYPTYGYGASYNPWTGAYTRGAVAYGPYGGAGVGAALQPEDRHLLARRGGLRSVRRARRGAGLQPAHRRVRRDAAGLERRTAAGARPACSAAISGPPPRATPTTSPARRRARRRRARAARRSAAPGPAARSTVAKSGSGDVYAGHDGNVYRKQGDSWQKYGERRLEQRPAADAAAARAGASAMRRRPERRSWDSATAQQVTRDSAARAEGTQRTRDASSMRSGSSSRSGSYRASGGARGGGRRR